MTPYSSCDQVFERLTRGPFPASSRPRADRLLLCQLDDCDRDDDDRDDDDRDGSSIPGDDDDAAVEAHLAVCHECRTLAEALRPAVAMMSESRDLPVYQGRLPFVAEYETADKMLRQTRPNERRAGKSVERFTWPLAAVALAGVLVGVCLTHLRDSRTDGAKASWLAWTSAEERADDRWTFASLRLSEACREPRDRHLAAAASLSEERVVCCTRCHASQASRAAVAAAAPPVEMSRLLVACLACHEG